MHRSRAWPNASTDAADVIRRIGARRTFVAAAGLEAAAIATVARVPASTFRGAVGRRGFRRPAGLEATLLAGVAPVLAAAAFAPRRQLVDGERPTA